MDDLEAVAGVAMTRAELQVGADAFWRRAADDCAGARRRLLVQAMTFEGDAAGKAVAAAVAASPARDRRVLVDAYSSAVISDRWVRWPKTWLGADLRAEKDATDAMFTGLTAGGVGVRMTNPLDALLTNYPARNHKKLIVADDVAWIGGINFSDHNFAWRDFMLRLEGAEAADFLAADFDATWSGRPRASNLDLAEVSLESLDGVTNDQVFDRLAALMAEARREIVVMSAYLTFPFTEPLAAAAARGVDVTLITPWENNKPLVRDYLLAFAERRGLKVRLLAQMSHVKGLLIDGETLVVGSCNFDFVGHAAEEELVAVIRDRGVIEAFRRDLIEPGLAQALPHGAHRILPLAGLKASVALRIAQVAARAARGARRTAVDWVGL